MQWLQVIEKINQPKNVFNNFMQQLNFNLLIIRLLQIRFCIWSLKGLYFIEIWISLNWIKSRSSWIDLHVHLSFLFLRELSNSVWTWWELNGTHKKIWNGLNLNSYLQFCQFIGIERTIKYTPENLVDTKVHPNQKLD